MSNFWSGVLSSIVAQWINVTAISAVSAILIFYITLSRRAKLFKFFGLNSFRSQPKLDIYLSNIRVVKGGALFSDGSSAVNFESNAVSAGEFLEISTIEKLFHPGILSYIPISIRNKLARWNIAFAEIAKSYEASPSDTSLISGKNIFLVGGPDFNAATRYLLNKELPYMAFQPKSTRSKPFVKIMKGTSQNQIITPHDSRMDLAIIQRQKITDENRVIIYASGNGSSGTRAAIRYLTENWGKLHKKFPNDDFAVCLQCEERELNPLGYKNWNVIRIIPELDRVMKGKALRIPEFFK